MRVQDPHATWLSVHQDLFRRKAATDPVEGWLESESAIRDLLSECAVNYDAGDVEAMVALFEPDATYGSFLGDVRGHDGLRANFQPLVDRYDKTAHLLLNTTVLVTSTTTAEAASYLHALVQTRDGIAYGLCASYQDRLSRGSGRWRFTSRYVVDGLSYRIEPIDPADRLPPEHH